VLLNKIHAAFSACCLLHVGFLHGLLFDVEDGGSNIGCFSPDYRIEGKTNPETGHGRP
jgi:hypothetical protein